jgi:hypothetical protein
MPAEDGELGFLVLEGLNARIWKRKAKSDGDAGWVLGSTIKLHLPLKRSAHGYHLEIIGFVEDYNVVFIATGGGVVFMVHLESAQFKKLPQKLGTAHAIHSQVSAQQVNIMHISVVFP